VVLDRHGDRRSPVGNTQLGEDIGDVELDGRAAHAQPPGNLEVAQPLDQQGQDLAFA